MLPSSQAARGRVLLAAAEAAARPPPPPPSIDIRVVSLRRRDKVLGLALTDKNIVTSCTEAAAKDGVRVGDRILAVDGFSLGVKRLQDVMMTKPSLASHDLRLARGVRWKGKAADAAAVKKARLSAVENAKAAAVRFDTNDDGFCTKTTYFVLRMMNCVLKMMNFIGSRRERPRRRG